MISFSTILVAIAPVFLMLGLGAALRRSGWLPRELDGGIFKLVVNVFYPALILTFILGNSALTEPSNIWLPPLMGFGLVGLGFLVGWWLAPFLGLQVGSGRRTFAFTLGVFNYGYIPIPIISVLFPGGETAGVLLVFNVGVELILWTFGIMLLSGSFNRAWWRKIFNGPIIALVVGMSLNLTGLETWVPTFLHVAFGWLGACTIPLGIILAGAAVMDLLQEKGLLREPKIPLAAILLRLVLLPMLFLLIAKYLPGATDELRAVIVVQSAMPCGMMPIVVSRYYGGSSRTAVPLVLATTFASLVTIPLWLTFGFWWLAG